jgi:hypothetical protein
MARGQHQNSLANLKPIEPGEVRNPLGINRKRPITDEYFQMSDEPLPELLRLQINQKFGEEILPKGTTWARANSLRRFLDAMMEGGSKAAKEIADRIEGKPPQRMEISGPEKKEITIRVKFDMQNP